MLFACGKNGWLFEAGYLRCDGREPPKFFLLLFLAACCFGLLGRGTAGMALIWHRRCNDSFLHGQYGRFCKALAARGRSTWSPFLQKPWGAAKVRPKDIQEVSV